MRRCILLRIVHQWPRQRPGLPHLPHALARQLALVAHWFHTLSDTTHLDILELLSQRDRAAGELQRLLNVPRSRVSFRLKVLRESRLIEERRDGLWRYSTLRKETLDLMIGFMHTVLPGAHRGRCPLEGCQDRRIKKT